ncbi:MAG: DUF4340 domain-containing protein [Longimicrobiales bacterium]
MKSVSVHAVLLAAALLVAFTTWRREDRPANRDTTTVVWEHRPADVGSLVFQSGVRTLELQRRAANDQQYVWGKETSPEPTTAPAPGTPASPSAHDTAHTPARDTTKTAPPRLRTEEFPAGKIASTLLENLATLRVVRDLGAADSTKRASFGLLQPEARLTVRFQDGSERVLALGNRVVGGNDRYAVDNTARRIYVLPDEIVRPLESSGSELRLTEYHDFTHSQLAAVTVRASGGERRMQRQTGATPQQNTWTPVGSSQPDQAFTNFMEQLNQLWISRFAPGVTTDSLESILRIEYFDDDADSLGLLELFRTRAAAGARTYYMRTRRTIVLGEVYTPLGERIEQDAATLFRAGSPTPRS